MISKTPATIPEPSSSAHHDLFSRCIMAPITTKTIVSVSAAPCSRITPVDDIEQIVANQCQPMQALGALLSLAVVVLTIVITGWVWTCWIMKKRQRIKITSDKLER